MPDERGHVLDGEHESRKHDRGHETREQGDLVGQNLGFGDDGDHQTVKQGSDEKNRCQPEDQSGGAAQGHVEQNISEPHGQPHIDHADEKIGDNLAQQQLGNPDGGGQKLFHGSGFPFPGDGYRGEHGCDNHHDDGHNTGNDGILAAQILIVQGPRAKLHKHAAFTNTPGLHPPGRDLQGKGRPYGGHIIHGQPG